MTFQSVACIVLEGGRVLIAKRLPGGDMGGRWEFPGGKVEAGEDAAAAIRREFLEEFSSAVTVGEHIAGTVFEHRNTRRNLDAYRVYPEKPREDFVLTEHTETAWIAPAAIEALSFVDSDLLILPEVIRYVADT